MNDRQNWKQKLAGGVAALALTAGAVTALVAMPRVLYAQDSGTAAVPAPPGPGDGQGRDGRGGMGAFGRHDQSLLASQLGITVEELQAAHEAAHTGARNGEGDPRMLLAQQLGITVDQLEAAQSAVRETQSQEALSSGQITQEQYDLIQAREAVRDYLDHEALAAQALGISVEQLQSYRDTGTRMDEVLAELGIDAATFRSNLEAAHAAALQQAVDDGVISAEQAAQLQEAPAKGFGGGRGHGGPKRGGAGVLPGAPPANAPAVTPEGDSNL